MTEYGHLIHGGKGVAAGRGEGRFQQLLDEVRSSMAIESLQNTLMPVEEIGRRIGFAGASLCRKAFKRWTHKPPGAYRRPGSAN